MLTLTFVDKSFAEEKDTQPASSASENISVDKKKLSQELKELRHSLAELKHAAKSLLGEFQRVDVRILEFGDFINDYIDDKPVPYQEQLYPYGFQNMGNTGTRTVPLAPRKEWVEHYSSTVSNLIALTESELSDLLPDLSSDVSTECSSLMTRLKATGESIKGFTETSSKDNCQKTIADLHDEISNLELFAKRVVRKMLSK